MHHFFWWVVQLTGSHQSRVNIGGVALMAYYKLSDVFECIQDYAKQGFEYLEIFEIGDEGSAPDTLCISAINEDEAVDDQINAVENPF